jgi:RNA-directed DNA polymerase
MIYTDIAHTTGLSPEYVGKVAHTASFRYKRYTIEKRNKSGTREIHHPSRELKLLQRWLVENVFNHLPVHDAVFSYRKNTNIGELVNQHIGSNYFVRIDFRDFFPSITKRDIEILLEKNWSQCGKGRPKADMNRISHIACRHGALTIGAPSSPALSNAVLYGLDTTWSEYANHNNSTYTRYADDIFISTSEPGKLDLILDFIMQTLDKSRSPRLHINGEKTVFTSRKHRVRMLGLILTPDGKISIGRNRKRYVKSMIHRFTLDELTDTELSYLRGYVSYLQSVEPDFIISLINKYGKHVVQSVLS